MLTQNLLPLARKWRIWLAVFLAIALFALSGALLARTVARNQAEIDETYAGMTIRFRLAPGRNTLSPIFSLKFVQLRRIAELECYKSLDFDAVIDAPMIGVMTDCPRWDPDTQAITDVPDEDVEEVTLIWAADPGYKYGDIPSWRKDIACALSPAAAERLGVGIGSFVYLCPRKLSGMNDDRIWAVFNNTAAKVTAISDKIPGDKTVLVSDETFMKFISRNTYYSNFTMSELSFELKPEENRRIREIEDRLQKIVNTNSPHDRNKFVSVYYNESEVDGIMDPLLKAQSSAVFFEKLFRTVLPVAVHVLELFAMLLLANEIGVRRLLGDNGKDVFFGIWLPVAAFLAACYLLSSLVILICGLGPYASWGTTAAHFAVSLGLTAAAAGLFCALNPLNLLKERNDE